ncbi:MAG: cell division protein FtsZ [Bacteroidales bacterium]|jgi:cell division protein FtsZ|nr:cell division protein FtsZ [Bacteroidales bacterium]
MREKIEFTPEFGNRASNANIKVIGVGGGGGNAVKHMYKEGIVGVDFLICNTDRQALYNNPVPSKLVLGSSGLGAGADPEVARELAEESAEALRDFIGHDTEMLFIAAGMGKGTGTGAAPVVARIAREMDILTIGVITYPFEYEGSRCANQAEIGIAEIKKHVDSLIIIQNEKIFTYYQNVPFNESFGYVDDVLKNSVKCIAELITVNAEVNVDFNDVKSVMKDSNSAMLGIATANGENRVEEVIDKALHCPLLNLDLISNAKNLLFFASSGTEEPISTSEWKNLTSYFKRYEGENVRVIWGYDINNVELGKDIKLSVILTNYETEKTAVPPFLPNDPPEPPTIPDREDDIRQPDTANGIRTLCPEDKPDTEIPIQDEQPKWDIKNANELEKIPIVPEKPIISTTYTHNPFDFINGNTTAPSQENPVNDSQSGHPSAIHTAQSVQNQIIVDNNVQIDMFSSNDDIYEDDIKYNYLINTPAAMQTLRDNALDQLIAQPNKVQEFNPFNNETDNDANEFLNSFPD